jgi:signal transduction histidine kinase
LLIAVTRIITKDGKPFAVHQWRQRLLADCLLTVSMLVILNFASAALFAYVGLILPVVVPSVSVIAGLICFIVYEREQLRAEAIEQQLAAMRQKHQAELLVQQAEARVREALIEREQRRDFVRRINHDLKAPLTVLNWNLSRLCNGGIHKDDAEDKVERLVKCADRLYELMAELTRSYDNRS